MADILVIEDDTQHLELLCETLKFGGHNPFPAKNIDIAKGILEEQKINLILTDISLPGITGLEFIESLQKQGINIPFIVITGSHEEEFKIKAEELKTVKLFYKPVDPEELLMVITKTQLNEL